MDFVALLKFRSSVSAADADAALGRRAAWKYPDGVKMIAEYWPLSTAVPVVSIMSADSMEKILEFFFEWNDVFDIVSVKRALGACLLWYRQSCDCGNG